MTNEELIDLANELKSDETTNPIGIFEEFAKENNINQPKNPCKAPMPKRM